MKRTYVAITVLLAAAALPATAQNFTIDWHTLDGGGAMSSTGGTYSLSGTIGQPDAGVMTGGTFEVSGGFWSVTQVCYCPGDLNHDGNKDGGDIQQFVNCLLSGGGCSCADVDLVGGVNTDDATQFVDDMLTGASCF